MATSAQKKAAAIKKAAAPKKAAVKKAAASKAVAATPVLKVVEGPIQFNVKQAKNIDMINKNQFRMQKAAANILDIAADSGMRLLALKDVVKGYGHGWKEWVQEGNLSLSYEQANRYCKLASHPKELTAVKEKGVTGIEEAVKQIEYIKKPEKQEAAEKKAAAVAAAPVKVPTKVPYTINAAFDMLQTFDLDTLREIQSYLADRIEELTQVKVEGAGDDDDTDAAEDAADAAEAVGAVEEVDPLS